MFKENFKAAFGLVLGFAAGCYAVEFIGNVLKQVGKTDKQEEKHVEKSKADIWEESVN